MPHSATVTTTVMFVDICDSTFLFSKLGDEKAFTLVEGALRKASELVIQHGGQVLRTKGDDILCTFSNPGDSLKASMSIHSSFTSHLPSELSMSIGINSGSALLSDGDLLGDTVNIAARLSNFAKAGQTLISSSTLNALDHLPSSLIRPFGEITLKGKTQPISTFEVLNQDDQDEITQVGPTPLRLHKSNRLTLRYQGQELRLDYLLNRFRLGRSPDCELVLDHPMVSRHHAEIIYRGNEFFLHDFSTNGTELITQDRSIHLHHKEAALRGRGSFFLGRTSYNRKFAIDFRVDGNSRDY